MSRHQYIRNLDYQDAVDEFEGYSDEEGGDELSPEDRALMNQGIVDVQAALGVEASKVTVAQIEEALWHYYYDIDKSVAYLTSKFINPAPKPVKQAGPQLSGKSVSLPLHPDAAILPSELDTSARRAGAHLDTTDDLLRFNTGSPPVAFISATVFSSFFHDMPWGNIPKHRETAFIPPSRPRGGLLGGSGVPPKMTKLQALAAARKKKTEEKKAEEQGATQDNVEQTRTKMTELAVGDGPAAKESMPLAGAFGKRLKTSESTAQGRKPLVETEPLRPKSQQVSEMAEKPEDLPPIEKAQPSAFAQTLFGLPSANLKRPEPTTNGDTLATSRPSKLPGLLPLYPNLPSSVFDAFSQPSPDDVVFAAQAKGSRLGKGSR